jgi:hypothetical protein
MVPPPSFRHSASTDFPRLAIWTSPAGPSQERQGLTPVVFSGFGSPAAPQQSLLNYCRPYGLTYGFFSCFEWLRISADELCNTFAFDSVTALCVPHYRPLLSLSPSNEKKSARKFPRLREIATRTCRRIIYGVAIHSPICTARVGYQKQHNKGMDYC